MVNTSPGQLPKALFDVIGSNSELENLTLQDGYYDDKMGVLGLIRALEGLSSLKTLSLIGFGLTGSQDLVPEEAVNKLYELESLTLWNPWTQLGDLSCLTQLLSQCPKLRELSLKDTQLGKEAGEAVIHPALTDSSAIFETRPEKNSTGM